MDCQSWHVNVDPERHWTPVGPGLLVEWLQAWVTVNFYNDEEGNAEHGMTFTSNGDPGWSIEIGLAGTELAGRPFAGVDGRAKGIAEVRVDEDGRSFRMSCGPAELSMALGAFMAWARPPDRPLKNDIEWWLYESANFPLGWLQTWFVQHCDGAWERMHSIRLTELDNPGWTFEVDLGDTELAGRRIEGSRVERGLNDWIHVLDGVDRFVVHAGPLNLGEALAAFRDWAVGAGEVA